MSWTDAIALGGAMLLIALALVVLQRVVPAHVRVEHNDVAGFIFAAVGVVYAVLLAFVVVTVWGNIDNSREATFHEADHLAGVYWLSRQLPAPDGPRLELQTLAYAHRVIEHEWPMMARHQSDPVATALIYSIRDGVYSFTPEGARQEVIYDHAVANMEGLAADRRQRLNEIGDTVPNLLWIGLIAGAVLTIGFTFLFGLSNTKVHAAMVLTLSALVLFSLIITKEMDYPFSGVTRIGPVAFQVFLDRLPPPH